MIIHRHAVVLYIFCCLFLNLYSALCLFVLLILSQIHASEQEGEVKFYFKAVEIF